MIRAGKMGLGSATMEAFQWAIKKEYVWIATMDADFSHDPGDLVRLYDATQSTDTADVIIGSRYVEGGRIEGWSWIRRWSSRLINLHARLFLGLLTRDNSGAFRIYKAGTLEKMGLETVKSSGYVYLQEVLFRLKRQGTTFQEVPITFRDRVRGKSKINWIEAAKAVWKIAILRFTATR